jgi:hypothetical protein
MYQKVVFGLFFCLVGILCIDFVSDLFVMDFTYYLLSLFFLGLGIVVYPLDFKFRFKTDFMFLPLIGLAMANFINVFFFADFSLKINCVNILAGIGGVLLCVFRKKIK